MKRVILVLTVFGMLVLPVLLGCGGGGGGGGKEEPTLTSIVITPANPSIALGKTRQLTATGAYSDGSTKDLTSTATWTSSDETKATVSAGLVTTVSIGRTTITASSGGISGSANAAVSAVMLPRTGQIVSYATGSIGDDGALQTGVAWPDPRFTIANSGTGTVVTDNLTGLIWAGDPTLTAPCSSATTTTWQGALDYVACLNANSYLEHNDWRLPNVNELESLVHAEYTNTALCGGSGCSDNAAWLNTQGFSNVQADRYWSSSTWVPNTAAAWYVNMDNSGFFVSASDKTTLLYYVWPVRSGQGVYAQADIPRTGQTNCYDAAGVVINCATATGQGQDGALQTGVAWPDPRFTVASSGTGTVVTDNLTGLMWAGDPTLTAPCSSATTTTWQGALDYVACLNANSYLGHNDWRLPNRKEQRNLANYGQTDSAAWLNTQGFSNVQASLYWSSSTYAASTSLAWSVYMGVGSVPAYSKTNNFSVWPVRGGQ